MAESVEYQQAVSRRVSGLSVRYSNPPALTDGCLVNKIKIF